MKAVFLSTYFIEEEHIYLDVDFGRLEKDKIGLILSTYPIYWHKGIDNHRFFRI
jgi:hypothetical protein